jgi:signal transduction histidine kinase/ActR/RegA family two-component response regulator
MFVPTRLRNRLHRGGENQGTSVTYRGFQHYLGKAIRSPVTTASLLGNLRIRAKLGLAFSAISGLVVAAAIVATIWTSNSDAEILRNLSLAAFAERQSTIVELNVMTMSDAMRGYLLNPSSQVEYERKQAADEALSEGVQELKVTLAEMPGVLRWIVEIERYDDEVLNKAEDRLLEIAAKDIDAAKRFYEIDYLPLRARETALILALRGEIEHVKEAVRAEAADTHAKQLALGLSGTAVILALSGLLAWLSGRLISSQIRAMTTAMGRLAAGDTTIEIPAQGSKDEIGDMAKAVDVFKQNMIHADRLAAERRVIEQQLIQAQKMEAIGNLTGGMAHDFNNVLGVIIGNLDLLARLIKADPAASELCGEALDGATRCADLIARLLAFARRQPLRPEQIDVNALVSDISRLLGRVLGDNIALSHDLDAAAWPVTADPAQLEAALVNLATNARDAMPNGGMLHVTTRNAQIIESYAMERTEISPGDYTLIEISDTGTGIPPEIIGRIFDPFFTTKQPTKGTGLGLSMVYGFVKQSGGHLSVYSEPGLGTTFRIYLPRGEADKAAVAHSFDTRTFVGGGETVLLVEDNPQLRRAAARQLTELGYQVREAEHADAALAIIDSDDRFDLLFSDIVMPGTMDGLELAQHVTQLRRGLKVLLASGFAGMREADQRMGDHPFLMLNKPYRRDELARAVRTVLDSGPDRHVACCTGADGSVD